MMGEDKEDRIRARAHGIWQREGSQEGHENDHWEEAEQELDAESTGAGSALSHDTAPQPSAPEKGIL